MSAAKHSADVTATQKVPAVPAKPAKKSAWTDPKQVPQVKDPGSPLTWKWDSEETPIGAALVAELKGAKS
jgi:hypothetical protein